MVDFESITFVVDTLQNIVECVTGLIKRQKD